MWSGVPWGDASKSALDDRPLDDDQRHFFEKWLEWADQNVEDVTYFLEDRYRKCTPALPEGTYYPRVFTISSTDDVQRYQLTVGIE